MVAAAAATGCSETAPPDDCCFNFSAIALALDKASLKLRGEASLDDAVKEGGGGTAE